MKIMTLTVAGLALTVASIAPALAGSRAYMDQPDYLMVPHSQASGMYRTSAGGYGEGGQVYEGRQAVEVYQGLSQEDATRLKMMQDKDANSNR